MKWGYDNTNICYLDNVYNTRLNSVLIYLWFKFYGSIKSLTTPKISTKIQILNDPSVLGGMGVGRRGVII